MGKPQSKSTSVNGDPQVNIINQLEEHSVLHEDHALKLWILLTLNIIQIAVTVYKWHEKRVRRKAYEKGMKSSEVLNKV